MTDLYYTPPSEEIFDEVKAKAILLWQTYDDQFGYATKKVDRIKDLANVSDNVMHIVAMFDTPNQRKLSQILSLEAKRAIGERIEAGGMPRIYNYFL